MAKSIGGWDPNEALYQPGGGKEIRAEGGILDVTKWREDLITVFDSIDNELALQTAELQDINEELDAQTLLLQSANSALGDINTELDNQTGILTSIDDELILQTSELQDINSELNTQTSQLASIDNELVSVNLELDNQTLLLTAANSALGDIILELNGVNSELDAQTLLLTSIDDELVIQTNELQDVNSELDTQTLLFQQANSALDDINSELDAQTPLLRRDFYVDVNFGLVSGYSMVGVVGQSDFVSNTYQDVWQVDADLDIPTSAESWEVVSTSADDAAAGTGVTSVLLIGLDANWDEQTEVITMNGTTAVSVPGTWRAVNTFVSASVGTAGKAGVAAGDISLQVSGGGNKRGMIRAGLNGAFNSFYTVPDGKEALWIQSTIYAQKGQDANLRSRFRLGENGVFGIGGNAPLYQNVSTYPFRAGLLLPARSMLFLEARTDNVGPSTVTTIAELILKDV